MGLQYRLLNHRPLSVANTKSSETQMWQTPHASVPLSRERTLRKNPLSRIPHIVQSTPAAVNVSQEDFFLSEMESLVLQKFGLDVFQYTWEFYHAEQNKEPLTSLKQFFLRRKSKYCAGEKSKFFYLDILDTPADSQEAMIECLHKIHESFEVGTTTKHGIVVGDAKSFQRLVQIKHDYGPAFACLPFPGDWHILKNFQPVLMKLYWDAGLKDICRQTHRGETLTSVGACRNFKRTHISFECLASILSSAN